MPKQKLSILVIGSGVIGSVYGGQLALAGHEVSILIHGEREQDVAINGLRLKNIADGRSEIAKIHLAATASMQTFDLVIVAVPANQLPSTFPTLRALTGQPHILFFGNNPDGHAAIPHDLPGSVQLAFPGVSGSVTDSVVEYIPINQQPTALEATQNLLGQLLSDTLKSRNLPIQVIVDMDGWLAHHTVFISCMSMAIIKSAGDAAKLGHNQAAVKQMCQAITEGFESLKRQKVGGAPTNLTILHNRWLLPISTWYWSKLLCSPKGEQYFAAHARHAPEEVLTLASWVLKHCSDKTASHLTNLMRQ